jgi:glycosyltransferase involved in cell wall biosynthesis
MTVPLVSRVHGSMTYFAHELGQEVSATQYRLERLSYGRVDAWSAVSRHAGAVTRELFRLPQGPDAVLYNPIVTPAAITPYAHRSTATVVFTGTLTRKKGIVSLFDAWPTIAARRPDARLHVYGKDHRPSSGRSMQETLLEQLPERVRGSVRFHGHVTREVLLQALDRATVAVFPSYSDACPYSALEAMAAGCPTVYTSRTCGPEIIRDGIDGLLADPDRPQDIAEAVLSLLDRPALAVRVSEAGRARVREGFALEALLEDNLRFFQDVVRAFGHRN